MKEGNIEPQVPAGDLKILQEVCEEIQGFVQVDVNVFNQLHKEKYDGYPVRMYSTPKTKEGIGKDVDVHKVFEFVNQLPYSQLRALYKMTEGMANQIGLVPPPPPPCPPACS